MPPSAFFGRSSLYSRRQRSTAFASRQRDDRDEDGAAASDGADGSGDDVDRVASNLCLHYLF